MGFKLTNQGSSKRLFFYVSSHYLLSRIPQISHFTKIKQKMYSPENNKRAAGSILSSIKTKIDCLLTFYIRTTFRNHPNSNSSKPPRFFPLCPHQSTKFTRLISELDRTAIFGKKKLQLLQLFCYGGILVFCCSTTKASLLIMFQSIFL